MATVLAQPRAGRIVPGSRDRLFYSTVSIVMAATVFAGFARTYYLPLAAGAPTTITGGPITPTVHWHALLFTAWVLLFVLQTTLIAARRVNVHRRLGYASLALAAGMIVVGLRTAFAAAARGAAPPGIDSLTFLVVPVFDIMLFTGFYVAAVLKRRNKEAHKRLMLLAYVSIITAAVARMPGLLATSPLVFFGLTLLFVVAGMIYDRSSRGRIHPVYLWGGGLIALSVPLRLALASTPAWRAFAEFVAR